VRTVNAVKLGELIAPRLGAVDPSRYQDEVFDLYSIPAFDEGEPDVVRGAEIGSTKQIVEPGDVLLSKIVPHIRRAWVVGSDRGRRLLASGEWIVFRSNRFDSRFLRHAVVCDAFHSEFMRTVSGVGGSLLRARPAHVVKIQVPLPTLSEQQRIADILDKADALRAKRRAALAHLHALTESIFLEMFGDPARNPKHWPTTTLSEVAEVVTGFPFQSERYVAKTEGIRLCRGANVLPGRLEWSDLACWPADDASGLASFRLETGDIVLAMDRPWIAEGFKIAQVQAGDTPSLLVQRVARIRARKEAHNEFLFHLLRQPFFTRHCRPTETTIPHISPTDLKSFAFPCPPIILQRTFADRIAKLRQVRIHKESALSLLDALFASLQHRAFRGEL
jgi:type I restriction enzyme S subunit